MQQNVAHKSKARDESRLVSSRLVSHLLIISQMPLPAVSTLKGGVAEGAGSVDYTPPMAKHLQLLRLHAERGSSGRGSWHESFSLVFWVSQRIENKCRKKERDRERARWRERQETRQQNKTTKDTAQHKFLC